MGFFLERIKSVLDGIERAKINRNFDKIEKSFNQVVKVVSERAYSEVVDAAKLLWLEPVATFGDLVTTYPNAVEGNAAMAREVVNGVNKVYRYNGTEWKEIQQYSADAINEVDHRLSTKLAKSNEQTMNFMADIAVNVKVFGAVGDGVADDTVAIMRALAYLVSRGGGMLYFPTGIYLIDFVLKIDIAIKVRGDGYTLSQVRVKDQSRLFHNTSRDDNDDAKLDLDNLYRDYHAVFFVNDCDFEIHDIELNGNAYNQTDIVNGIAWHWVSPAYGTPKRNYFKYYHGIVTRYENIENPRLIIQNTKIHNFSWNGVCVNNHGIHKENVDIDISKNIFEHTGQDAVSIHRVSNWHIYDNDFYNFYTHGVHAYFNVENGKIHGNRYILNQNANRYVPAASSQSVAMFIGHGTYDENFVAYVDIFENTVRNQSTIPLDAVVLAKTIYSISVRYNRFYNVLRGILSSSPPINQNNFFEGNEIFYQDGGIILRPFDGSTGAYASVATSVTKPFRSGFALRNNKFRQVNGDNSKYAISWRTGVTSDLTEYALELDNNDFGGGVIDLPETSIFKVRYGNKNADNLVANKIDTKQLVVGNGVKYINANKYVHSTTTSSARVPLFKIQKNAPVATENVQLLITLVGNGNMTGASSVAYDIIIDMVNNAALTVTKKGAEGTATHNFTVTDTGDMYQLNIDVAGHASGLIHTLGASRQHLIYNVD